MSTTYLAGALLTMLVWYILFMHRRDVRKEMLFMSVLAAVSFAAKEMFFWSKVWMKPPTITGTLVGPEDLLLGFGMGGIAAVAYEVLFEQRHRRRRERHCEKHHGQQLILLIALAIVIGCGLFFGLGFGPGAAWAVAVLVPVLWIWVLRQDLVIPSITTGALLLFFAAFVFAIMNWLDPGFVMEWWGLEGASGMAVLQGLLADAGWTFTAGMFLGCVYEFWQGSRFRRLAARR